MEDISIFKGITITALRFYYLYAILWSMETYTLIRSRRRTLALEITRDCKVLVRAPMHCSETAIRDFLARNQDWITRHMQQVQARAAQMGPPPTPEEIEALKNKARRVLPEKVQYYSSLMGLFPTGLRITTARKRYGSCSATNSLCFSCFLMLSPDDAIDAVVVHELAHIRYKNHGSAFYALIEQYLPDYSVRKKHLL